MKAEQSENDAIIDDLAGKAYVQQFGLETLERAENTMNRNRVSR
jgi:vacuolar protein sorting-associated protein VTA1